MRVESLPLLRCPACRRDGSLGLGRLVQEDEREVREGTLTCKACAQTVEVSEGIADLLLEPPDFVVREAAGLQRFADVMRADGWDRAKVRKLPDLEDPYWYGQRVSLDQVLEVVQTAPGQRLLDVGSNTCWASNIFARRGLEVIALDIARAEMQGLRTAEYFIDSGEVFFERVLSNMSDPAIASNSLDIVFCCEVLHHNDLAAMRRTFREMHRVLKPGGVLIAMNEPMRFPLNLKRDHAAEVAQFEGNENVHFFHQYFLGARRAGFSVQILPPRYVPFLSGQPDVFPLNLPWPRVARRLVRHAMRRFRLTRRLYAAWLLGVKGDASLNMVCRKR